MRFKVKLVGRLGNQMFQYAFGYALSRYYDCELYLQKNKYTKIDEYFNIDTKKDNYIWDKLIKEKEHYKENDEKKLECLEPGNYLIDGCYQDENCFKLYKQEIKSIFKLPKFDISKNDLVLHIRRGDYVNNPRFFYCDFDWYIKAISTFNCNKLHIVSDDLEWCKIHFKQYDPILVNLPPLNSMGYISSFSNIIISNSSFSWWGAYLSNANNIVCPSVWSPKIYQSFHPGLSSWNKISK